MCGVTNSCVKTAKRKNKLLKRQYENRDFEIRNLWQRSIFLATFITLLCTGYGAMWNAALQSGKAISAYHPLAFNAAGALLSLLLFIFSILWIAMGQGSKYWYENYERKIAMLESDFEPSCMRNSATYAENHPFPGFSACRTSPSKINILIGFVWAVVSLPAMALHISKLVLLFFASKRCVCEFGLQLGIGIPFAIVIAAIILVGVYYLLVSKSESNCSHCERSLWNIGDRNCCKITEENSSSNQL